MHRSARFRPKKAPSVRFPGSERRALVRILFGIPDLPSDFALHSDFHRSKANPNAKEGYLSKPGGGIVNEKDSRQVFEGVK